MNEQQYILISKVLADEATSIEKQQLEDWINASSENKTEFDKITTIWQSAKPSKPAHIPGFNTFWKEFNKDPDANIKTLLLNKPAMKFNRYLAIAASLIILVGSLLIFQNNVSSVQTVNTSIGERKTINLPDGSIVKLNNDSEVQYSANFDQEERNIYLTGQAFFEVKKNNFPFVVHTQNARVEVLGTRFDVNSRGEQTKVIVKSGQVRLAINENDDGILLHKNEMSAILQNDKPREIIKIDAEHALGWLNDIFVFDKTPLIEITQELERYYGIKIKIDDSIRNLELTGEFSNQPAEEVIDLVCLALNLNYNYENDIIIISR